MPRAVRGVLAIEDEQTGDGRVLAAGALSWADLPLPLGILLAEQHASVLMGGPQIGTIDTIERAGNEIRFTGTVDDENPDGAEALRRMDAGSAPLGNRWGVSIDPDDYEVQLIDMRPEEPGDVVVIAAAGDPDPGEDGGELLFEDSADSLLERYTRLRIRGATACAIAAFAGAYMEVAEVAEPVVAAAVPTRPPAAWFGDPGFAQDHPDPALRPVENPDGTWGVPWTITEDGRVFGHLARWGSCHVGNIDRCRTPPPSPTAYSRFRLGAVLTAEGAQVPTGAICLGIPHADLTTDNVSAQQHYDCSRYGVADVAAGEDVWGPWIAGALRPGVSEEQVRLARALVPSGDWRPYGGELDLIAVSLVNVPGFGSVRALAAAASTAVPEMAGARVRVAQGQVVAMVAAGLVPPRRAFARPCDCGNGHLAANHDLNEALRAVDRQLGLIERRTRHLLPDALRASAERVRSAHVGAERD